ncbi:LysR family transcriptional regulator [Micromonospora sp. DR5-3]|uniref:LysR family transcriptional regulator n=1 Tax=unclassified Micromonospora TaxID=2617518 RepID=UPI0011D8EF78|nr:MULTISPECIES: LysR family transcriptional regulator [unclassified Micromonospora]MCW3820773.1 LysR family transcriptional regulator [Micromonospora sp. DR5-3]TYC21807.1 LysR family transcriptional regulator [Micromonospora sp. MP36]
MLKPEHLRTLREVIQLGSFAAAANRLGYTSSAVSQQIAALERQLGVKLFDRSAHSVLPTSAAEVLARHAETVLTDMARMVATVQAVHRNSERQFHLGIFPSFADVLTGVLRRMEPRERAGIRVTVAESSQLIPRLGAGGEMDAAIVYQVGNSGLSWPSALGRRWIAVDRYKLVLPRDWADELAPYRAEQLVDLPWIMHHPGSSDASFFDGVFSRWSLHPRVAGHSDDFKITMAMVEAGAGAALVPDLALRGHGPGVVVADVPWLNTSRNIFTLVRPDRETTRLLTLLDALAV